MMSDKFKNCQENLELFAIDHEYFLTPFPLNAKDDADRQLWSTTHAVYTFSTVLNIIT